jgi:hypothetical protein
MAFSFAVVGAGGAAMDEVFQREPVAVSWDVR